jgi:hypothetical protein
MIFCKAYIYFPCLAESTAQQYLGPARMLTYIIINVPLLLPKIFCLLSIIPILMKFLEKVYLEYVPG